MRVCCNLILNYLSIKELKYLFNNIELSTDNIIKQKNKIIQQYQMNNRNINIEKENIDYFFKIK